MRKSKRAWLDRMVRVQKNDLPEAVRGTIRKDLTLLKKKYGGDDATIKVFEEDGKSLWLPRWYGARLLQGRGFELVDQRSDGFEHDMEFRGSLGTPPFPSGQPLFVEEILAGLRENGFGGFGVADCGMGKTVMGSAVAAALGKSTLVLVHRKPLVSQWRESLRRHLRVAGKAPKVGLVSAQEERCDYGPSWPVSIAMIQSLNARDYPDDFYRAWGLITVDETHHVPAKTWLEVVGRFSSRYVVGLTATLRRKDGLQPVFTHTMGDVLSTLHRDNVQADAHFYGVHFLGGTGYFYTGGGPNRTRVEKRLASMESRNKIVSDEIVKAVASGRKCIMVFSGIREHLSDLYNMLPFELRRRAGFYVGRRKQEVLDKVARKQIILATYGMADEGLDIQEIDAVFLATPRPDVEQPVGRALRFYVKKRPPLIVDFVDKVKLLVKWAGERKDQYIRMGLRLRNSIPACRR